MRVGAATLIGCNVGGELLTGGAQAASELKVSVTGTILARTSAPSDPIERRSCYLRLMELRFCVASTGYGSLASFLIPAAAFGANNTFQVAVQNDPCNCAKPTGLLVSAEVAATPLPATLPLFAFGIGVLGLLGWRRKIRTGALAA